jgi:hypothetical protein
MPKVTSAPGSHLDRDHAGRRFVIGRFLRSKLWTRLFGSGFVAGIASALVGAWAAAHWATPAERLTSQPPLATVETQRQANDELGLPNVDVSPSDLNKLGVAVRARFHVAGLSGSRSLTVRCKVYAADAPAGWWSEAGPYIYGARNGSQITSPCFVALPPSRRPRRYNAVALLEGTGGFASQSLATSFIAPPTAR